jgi:DNA processing protein
VDSVNTLKFTDDDFPAALKTIASPPRMIYWAGQKPESWLHLPKVGIVGSRKLSAYGQTVTRKLSSQLASHGVVIVSGLAYGIDVTAHLAALDSGGTTVAILPSGLDSIYPAAHQNIARRIAENGCLITEYPPKTMSFPSNFIARNRLISGLSDILIVTEAALKSGSLHTARFALEQGKTVMAVPGNITSPGSEGCNNLIKSGAVPVTAVDDVFFALKLKPNRSVNRPFAGSPEETIIINLINEGVNDQEELALATKIAGAELASTLTMLEIGGHIRPAGNGRWVRY